jgi:OFA family oxalate/formate antiporter-like MFS transporter
MGSRRDGEENGSAARASPLYNPWVQLAVGIVGMVAITNLQYGWTFFEKPIDDKFGWGWEAIQWAFTLFVLAETWLVPVEGYLVDRFGPRLPVAVGGVLIALAWGINAWAESLTTLYVAGVIGGAGAGVVYGASIGNALKWFADRRGLAAGLTAAAFGAGSALTVQPLIGVIRTYGYERAFLWFGLAQGVLVLLCALAMRVPPSRSKTFDAKTILPLTGRDFTWREMLRTPIFWLLYVMMTLVSVAGLTFTPELSKMARDYQVADVDVTLLGVTMAALPFAAQIDRVLNGVTRPVFGWISDHLGRENTMFLAFALEGTALFLFIRYAHNPMGFVLLTGLVFFAWGEIYSLFPAVCGDLFGRKFATTNYGLLYTAKGAAALLLPLVRALHETKGSWTPVLWLFVGVAWMVAVLALFVLKPLRARMHAEQIKSLDV